MRKYKAIVSDIDGTLTPISPSALPSGKTAEALQKSAQKGIIFSLATGRPFYLIEYLITHLHLKGPMITDNGAAIIESETKKVLWEAVLPHKTAYYLIKLTKKYSLKRLSCDTLNIQNPENIPDNITIRKFSVHDIADQEADKLIKKVEIDLKDLAITKAASYKSARLTDVYFSHAEATKQYAIAQYARLLGITTREIIGIGDGYNDFPLLMACGFKIAMGNAVKELKDIADYVAPSVENDGIADVIERFT